VIRILLSLETGGGEGVNAIVVEGRDYLLAEISGGRSVHLVPTAASDEDGEAAVPMEWLDPSSALYADTAVNYDRESLQNPRWARRTLCGKEWAAMAAGEAGPINRWQHVQLSPSCRRCLASIDRLLPAPSGDDRIELRCTLIVQAVESHGYAEVTDVPRDQMGLLRAATRARPTPARLRIANARLRRPSCTSRVPLGL
jgi:hypothetical protein